MKPMRFSLVVVSLSIVARLAFGAQHDDRMQPYVDALRKHSVPPTEAVMTALQNHDLVIFDDALHTAVEPFEFYCELVRDPRIRRAVDFVFLEVIPMSEQPALDAFFASDTCDVELLLPAFQSDFGGTGLPYATYFDLLQTIWQVNSQLPEAERIRVIAVNAPAYWGSIHSRRDVELFRQSLVGNDYTMYKIIRSHLEEFDEGLKGIFLTNTRHAYKDIRNGDGRNYWNCATFFHHFDPGVSYSIRLHNITIRLSKKTTADDLASSSTEGLEDFDVSWSRVEDGLWDSAFAARGNEPVAIALQNTPFGRAAYTGNHMLDAAPGQTMSDAYDALIFLAPVDLMRQTAMVDWIYTEDFKQELVRRAPLLYSQAEIDAVLASQGFSDLRQFIDAYFVAKPEVLQPLAADIGRIDAWKVAR